MLVKLKGKRVEKGYTQEKMAELLKMEQATYARKENEKSTFNIDEANRILRILNCKYEDIFLNE